jgi:hypothetical protein
LWTSRCNSYISDLFSEKLGIRLIRGRDDDPVYCVDAFVFDPEPTPGAEPHDGLLGFRKSDFVRIAERGQSTMIAQFYGLVADGMIQTRHVFRGLRRPATVDDNSNADSRILTYTRKPARDCVWNGSPFEGRVERIAPPSGAVFVVHVTPNTTQAADYPEIRGWINHWTWVDEDAALSEAPVEWVSRYQERLWTRYS